jgi:hypothetical protein
MYSVSVSVVITINVLLDMKEEDLKGGAQGAER